MTVDRLVDRISGDCRSSLLDTLDVRLSTGLSLPGQDPYPPGAVDYRSRVQLTWYPEDGDPTDFRILESVAAQGTEVDEGIGFDVGQALFLVVDLLRGDLFDALDARDADLAYLGGILFPHLDKGDHYEIEDELQITELHAVLVNSVEIDPLWRGMRLGLLSTGIAINELGRGCSFAALEAMQPGVEDRGRRQSVHKRLTWYWRQLGFDSWRERVMILDLSTTTLDDKLAALVNAT